MAEEKESDGTAVKRSSLVIDVECDTGEARAELDRMRRVADRLNESLAKTVVRLEAVGESKAVVRSARHSRAAEVVRELWPLIAAVFLAVGFLAGLVTSRCL